MDIKYRTAEEQLRAEIKQLTNKVERYEKALKEIAADEENCIKKSYEYMDHYDGFGKTIKAKKALNEKAKRRNKKGWKK